MDYDSYVKGCMSPIMWDNTQINGKVYVLNWILIS